MRAFSALVSLQGHVARARSNDLESRALANPNRSKLLQELSSQVPLDEIGRLFKSNQPSHLDWRHTFHVID
jgi:hypothetical protein